MAQNDLTKFFNLMFDKRQTFDIAEGILQDKRDLNGRVSFVGNPVSQPASIMQGATVSVGNRCLCVRPKTSARWIVLGSFGTPQIGYLPQRSPESGFEIYPPGGIVAVDAIPGSCMWSWYAPPEKPVVFEVQTSATGTEDDAVTEIRTRGSYFIKASDANVFLRVRSIQSDYNHSAWSSWYECAPGTAGIGVGTVTSVSLTTPSELTTTGSPVTSSGGFTVSWHTQSANKIFAGPSSGGAAAPTFRDMVFGDTPDMNTGKLLGRYGAGTGKMQELAIGSGLYVEFGTLKASGSGGSPATGVIYKQTKTVQVEVILYDETLVSDQPYMYADLTVSPNYSSVKDIRIVANLRSDSVGGYGYATFWANGASDSTGVIGQRGTWRDGGSTTDQWPFIIEMPGASSYNADRFSVIQGYVNDIQSSKFKILRTNSATPYAAPGASQDLDTEDYAVSFATSAPLTNLKLAATTYPGVATGNIAAGSRLTIYGLIELEVVVDVTGDIGLTVDPNHIVGRYSPDTGQFEQILIGAGLYLADGVLYATATGGGGGTGTGDSFWQESAPWLSPVNTGDKVVVGAHTGDDAAIMQLDSSEAGFLMPRMTTAERDAIATPPDGLQIFNTDTGTVDVFGEPPTAPTLSDLPTIATNRLLGRHTSGSGHPEELQIGHGLALDGDTLNSSTSVFDDALYEMLWIGGF